MKKTQISRVIADKYSMNKGTAALARKGTFEDECNEAIACAMEGLRERPHDLVTRSACAYLLRHLAREDATGSGRWLAPAAQHCFQLGAGMHANSFVH